MITKSRITGKHVLNIFENFRVDRGLPKFTVPVQPAQQLYTVITSNDFINGTGSFTSSGSSSLVVSDPRWSEATSGETPTIEKKKGWLDKIFGLFQRKKNVMKVFTQIFENLEQLKEYKSRIDVVAKALEVAKKNGQVALVEKIESTRDTYILESKLLALGFIKVITEEQLINFAFDSERGLRLDWLRNFTRNVPADVMEKKDRADVLKIFDNYVILHYDPENKHNTLTREEVAKKKDPILFGVCEGTRKLYYVGDWKDEYCDLTFDDLIAKIGEDNLKIGKEAV